MMKNNNNLKTYAIISTLLTIICVITVVFTPHYFVYQNNYAYRTCNEDVYILENNQKVSFDYFGKTLDTKEIDLYVDITNSTDDNHISFGTYNYYQAIEIYESDELIYKYGSLEDLNNNVHLGNKYCQVDLELPKGESTILRIHLESNYDLVIYDFDLGSKDALDFHQFITLVPVIILGFASLIAFGIFVYIFFQKKYVFVSRVAWVWVCYFIMTSSIWIIADSQLLTMLGENAGITCQIAFELYPIFTLSLLKAIQSIKDYKSKSIEVLTVISLINFIVLNILDYTGTVPFVQSLLTTHIITIVVMLTIMWIIGRDFKENHTKRNAIQFYGFLTFLIFAAIQYVFFFINPTANNSNFLIVGLGALYLTLIIDIMHTISLNNKRNDAHYHKMIEEANAKLEKRNEQLYETFGRLVPNTSIDTLLNKDLDSSIDGTTVYCTVLDADIRGFTDLIGNMEPSEVIKMLNDYLKTMTNIITKYKGTVIEYIGDSILAVFGAPLKDNNHASLAIAAALEMQIAMRDISSKNIANNLPVYEIGIGITSGNAYIGYLGSKKHMKFDVIGSTVNLCSRIQSYSSGGQILISEETYKLSNKLDVMSSYQILPKGMNELLNIYSIIGIGKPYNITYLPVFEKVEALSENKEVNFRIIDEDKSVDLKNNTGVITKASKDALVLKTDIILRVFDNIQVEYNKEMVYGKVVEQLDNQEYLIRLTIKNHSIV